MFERTRMLFPFSNFFPEQFPKREHHSAYCMVIHRALPMQYGGNFLVLFSWWRCYWTCFAKVNEIFFSIWNNNVVTFQITVAKAFFVHVCQGISHIKRNLIQVLSSSIFSLWRSLWTVNELCCSPMNSITMENGFCSNCTPKIAGMFACESSCIIWASSIISLTLEVDICFSATRMFNLE